MATFNTWIDWNDMPFPETKILVEILDLEKMFLFKIGVWNWYNKQNNFC